MDVFLQEPPWFVELRARNCKVGRRQVWSTSDIPPHFLGICNEDKRIPCSSLPQEEKTKCSETAKVIDPIPTITAKNGIFSDTHPVHVEIDSNTLKKGEGDMKTPIYTLSSNGEESLIEYGPGIVRKLRTKYQTLSARQYASRPSLRRSTSLELRVGSNSPSSSECTISSKSSTPEPPLPSRSQVESPVPSRGSMTLNIRPDYICSNQYPSRTVRGRPTRFSGEKEEINLRLRRARSVDALHSVVYTPEEEEILEKFKNVVLPKEEVVIIEMPKPQLHLNLGEAFQDKKSTNYNKHSRIISSLISPQNELPPHDIVRETARIFEINPSTNWKKTGQVLRLSKSSSLSPPPCSSPPLTSISKKCQVVPPTQKTARLTDLRVITNNQQSNKIFKTIMNGRNQVVPGVGTTGPSPGKQIGIIRPTISSRVSGSQAPTPHIPPRQHITAVSRAFQFITPAGSKPSLCPKPAFLQSKSGREKVEDTCRSSSKISSGIDLDSSNDRIPTSHSLEATQKSENSSVEQNKTIPTPIPSIQVPLTLPTEPKSQEKLLPLKLSKPVGISTNPIVQVKANESLQTQGTPQEPAATMDKPTEIKMEPLEESTTVDKRPNTPTPLVIGSFRKETAREGDALKKASIENLKNTENSNPDLPAMSQLRSYQKQKSQRSTNGGGSMVFNFTKRSTVPDYIEDDGLHRIIGNGDEAMIDDVDGGIDAKLIHFIGANVIINGKSSIQKKPKTEKFNIRFDDQISKFEYPSESTALDEMAEIANNNQSSTSPVGLGNYVPIKLHSSSYQLGIYGGIDSSFTRKSIDESKGGETEDISITEHYLKPDTGSTTWSNELGHADILF